MNAVIVVNGNVVATREVPADDKVHELTFDVALERSRWVALRQFPRLHTNPVNVLVAGVLMLGEAYHHTWEATADRALRPHVRAFGLMNGFEVEDVDRVEVTQDGQLLRYGAIGVEALFWVFVVAAWRRRSRLER